MKIAVGLLVVLVLGLGGFGGYQTYQLQEMSRSMDALRAEHQAQVERSKADGGALQAQLATATADGEALRAEVAEARAQLAELQTQLNEAQSQLGEARAQLADSQAKGETLQAQVAALSDKSSRVELRAATVERLAQARNALTRAATSLKAAADELDQGIKILMVTPDDGTFKSVQTAFAKLKRAHGDLGKADVALTTELSTSAAIIGGDAPEYTGARAELLRCREAQTKVGPIIAAFEQGTKRGDFTVVADQAWQTSAVDVLPGDVVALKYAGSWVWGPRAGNRVDYRGENGAPEYRAFSNAPNGALVLRVRGSEQAAIASATFVPDRRGPIEFRINDSQVADNSGAIDVTIYVVRVPH